MKTPLEIALKEYGQEEIPGYKNNPRILEYAKKIGQKTISRKAGITRDALNQ